jgi:hypothetical protein
MDEWPRRAAYIEWKVAGFGNFPGEKAETAFDHSTKGCTFLGKVRSSTNPILAARTTYVQIRPIANLCGTLDFRSIHKQITAQAD